MTTQNTINQINDLYRDWKKLTAAQAAVNLQCHAAIRRVAQDHYCGGSKCFVKKNALCAKDKALATKVHEKWKRIFGKRNAQTLDRESDDPVEICAAKVEATALPLMSAVKNFDPSIAQFEKDMVALVDTLPIAEWVDEVTGLSRLGLAKIMSEAGNEIGLYKNPSRLWKRFGLGMVSEKEGEPMVRQRRHRDTDLGILHGYNPKRRALMYVIQGTVYQNGKKKDNEYYQYAEEVKAKAELKGWAKGHVFKHQRRLLSKRILRNLWVEWRKRMPMPDASARLDPSAPLRPVV